MGEGESGSDMADAEEFGIEVSYATAVNTKITSSPLNPSNSPDATFKFKCNKKSCVFKCKLDGNVWEACKSPKSYSGLSSSAHSFQVKAKDKATGKWDKTPARYSWSIILPMVSAGWVHTCALLSSGGIKCWGYNAYGQLGNGNNNNSNVPVDASGLASGVSAVSAGYSHTCAVLSSGALKCWGWNIFGQLGNGDNKNSNVPVDVSGLSSGVSAVSGGGYHTCALLSAGGMKCWGYNEQGQLGNGDNDNSNVPVDVVGFGP